jgi:ketosteroid isomerase-like protein
MKQTLVACVLAAVSLSAFGQTKSEAPKSGAVSVEQTLLQMEKDWTQAGLKKDVSAFDKIVADDWVALDFQGKTVTKAQAIADMKSGSSSEQSVDLGEMKVRVFGNTAVVTGSDTEKSTYQGKDSSGKYVWMDVFVNRNGKWQAVASESTKVAN